jgi:hypothetical protein
VFLAASYGVLRSSFADAGLERAFGERRFDKGTFGGGPTRIDVSVSAAAGARG